MNGCGKSQLLVKFGEQPKPQIINVIKKEPCDAYKPCGVTLSSGCNTVCKGDYMLNPMCQYPGITGLIGPEPGCILFDGQIGTECVGCKTDCATFPGGCPIPPPPPGWGYGNAWQ